MLSMPPRSFARSTRRWQATVEIGRREDDVANVFVGQMRGQPVRAEDEAIAGAQLEPSQRHRDVRTVSHRLQITPRYGGVRRLLRRQGARVKQLLNQAPGPA